MRMATAVVTRSGDVPGGTTGDVAGSRPEASVSSSSNWLPLATAMITRSSKLKSRRWSGAIVCVVVPDAQRERMLLKQVYITKWCVINTPNRQ